MPPYPISSRLLKIDLPNWQWLVMVTLTILIVGYLDWLTGIEMNFFVFYFLPVSIAAWALGFTTSVYYSIFAALAWFAADFYAGHEPSNPFYSVWDFSVHLTAFVIIGRSISQIRILLNREQQLSADLRRSLVEIKTLEAILPICCQCKKIRDDKGDWQQIEAYISTNTDTIFSHGFCPECYGKVMAETGFVEAKSMTE
jgi:hypothetical protein